MGQLVRQKTDTLFNGVSRQPASMRLPNQVEAGDNVVFSVVTGGFSKRAGAELVAELTADVTLAAPAVYSYKRDTNEAYFIAAENGRIIVWAADGTRRTVNYKADAADYLASITGPEDAAFATLGDTTVVLNKTMTTAMNKTTVAPMPSYSYGIVQFIEFANKWTYDVQIDFAIGDRSGTAVVTDHPLDSDYDFDCGLGATRLAQHLNRAFAQGFDATFDRNVNAGSLAGGFSAPTDFVNWTAEASGSDVFIRATTPDDLPYDSFIITVRDTTGGGTMRATSDYVPDAEQLTAKAWGGMITRIGGEDEKDGNQYFEFVTVPEDGASKPARLVSYTADGTTTDFATTFDYDSKYDVIVTVDGTTQTPTTYVWVDEKTLRLATAPAAGATVILKTEETNATGHGSGYWQETVKPGAPVQFDAATMPHVLVRRADGDFDFAPLDGSASGADDKPLTWAKRRVGDTVSMADPDFIGHPLSSVGFHRSRLYVLAGEYVCFTQVNDFFNWWGDSAAEAVASDPFSRIAGTGQVSHLVQAYPFRKALIVSSEQTQFEVSSNGALTPDTATIDASTSYIIETGCAPVALGSEVYFATRNGASADVLEYYYEDASLSNTAERIATHVPGYIPTPIIQMAADPVTGAMFVRSAAEPTAVYAYRLHWSGRKKAQSAWGRWTFNAKVVSVRVFDGYVWTILDYGGRIFLSRLPLNDNEGVTGLPYPCRLDNWQALKGEYHADLGKTYWTFPPLLAPAPQAVLGEDFGEDQAGRQINVTLTDTGASAAGDWSAGTAYIGDTFRANVELSAQYLRQQDHHVVTAGRLQLRSMTFHYVDSGVFDISVEPERRRGRVIRKAATGGDVLPGYRLAADPMPGDGSITAPVRSRAETTRISVRSDSPTPMTITSADWLGFYNEVSRNK